MHMPGIAGVNAPNKQDQVNKMLDAIAYRGRNNRRRIIETENATMGMVFSAYREHMVDEQLRKNKVFDGWGNGHCAEVSDNEGNLVLSRDELGVAPLYYGKNITGDTCFASEVKALQPVTHHVTEVLPGTRITGEKQKQYFTLEARSPENEDPTSIARELRKRLETAVSRCIHSDTIGSWLSGGLDSSTIAALAGNYVKDLHTFASGLKDAPDLEYAREVASFIKSKHHEVVITFEEMLQLLPKVIYHLESFDSLLVRSSITNYAVARAASDYTGEVFSGEGGDEFFAGYAYLKSLPVQALPDELIDISKRLHNTALQRVDRCASAHGTMAHVVFADPLVFNYAIGIPVVHKIHQGVEKWILRRAMDGALPERVLMRTKVKFWEGAGVGELLFQHASGSITNHDFRHERILPNGWILNTKEELMYYKIFREYFGDLENLDWMGRTKGNPVQGT
jgi:asparagine synthase (glutamine-hydrolysing)